VLAQGLLAGVKFVGSQLPRVDGITFGEVSSQDTLT